MVKFMIGGMRVEGMSDFEIQDNDKWVPFARNTEPIMVQVYEMKFSVMPASKIMHNYTILKRPKDQVKLQSIAAMV
jgi:hypothetical protein